MTNPLFRNRQREIFVEIVPGFSYRSQGILYYVKVAVVGLPKYSVRTELGRIILGSRIARHSLALELSE
jgi:hypothetical protein